MRRFHRTSDGVSSYPNTPSGQCGAEFDFDLEELYEEVEVALENVENHVYAADAACAMQLPMQLGYSDSDFGGEYSSPSYTRGRNALSKPLGDAGVLSLNLSALPMSSDGFAPTRWIEPEMPFITQTVAH